MLVNLAVEMAFVGPPDNSDDQFEAFLDEVIDQFDHIGYEVNLAARIAERAADFAVTIDTDDFEDAICKFMPDLRTALHGAGCGTPGWPVFRPKSRVVRELQDAA